MTKSDKWDRIEKIKSMIKKDPIFNISLLILVGLIVFGATFAYVHFIVPPAYAGETFKVFDDGVTYIVEKKNAWLYEVDGISIFHDGVEYDCTPNGYHNNQYLNPVCIEIILRSIP